MKKLIFLLCGTFLYAGTALPAEATAPLKSITDWMLGLLVIVMTLAYMFCGYLYITGKQEKAKEYAINITYGGIFVGISGTIAGLFGK